MKIKVSFFGPIKRPFPESTKELDTPQGTTIAQLLLELGYTEEEVKRVACVVNGRRRSPSTQLFANDDVRFVLFAGGG